MIKDPLLKEVRRIRREILESHGSMRNYHNAIIENQKKYGNRLVSHPPKKVDSNKISPFLTKGQN